MNLTNQTRQEKRIKFAYPLRRQPMASRDKDAASTNQPRVYKDIDALLKSRQVLGH